MRFYRRIDGKFSSEDVDDIVQNVVASARLEGMPVPKDEVEMLRRLAADEISYDEYMRWLLARVGVTQ